MSGYNAKNYTEQGGDRTVIGGSLEIREGATVTGFSFDLQPASFTTLGGVKAAPAEEEDTMPVSIDEDGFLFVPEYPPVTEIPEMENQPNSVASTIAGLVVDFNALLMKLKDVGLMEADNPV